MMVFAFTFFNAPRSMKDSGRRGRPMSSNFLKKNHVVAHAKYLQTAATWLLLGQPEAEIVS